MTAPRNPAQPRRLRRTPAWHDTMITMLPGIRAYAAQKFTHLDPEAREEAISDVVAYAAVAMKALARRGKLKRAYPTVLALYGVKRVRSGRKVGMTMNGDDVSSEYCQKKRGIRLERLDHKSPKTGTWCEVLVEDRHAGPAETAAARIDVGDWLGRQPARNRRIAELLAVGERAKDVARWFGLTDARISQLRTGFRRSWQEFHGDADLALSQA
jgi:hypothetical protein